MRKPWVERNAGQATERVRAQLRGGPMTYDELVTATGYSYSAVRAARKVLRAVAQPEDKSKRDGACGKFPTLWALPKEKRR